MTRDESENLLREVLCDKEIHHYIQLHGPGDVFTLKRTIRFTILALQKLGKLK